MFKLDHKLLISVAAATTLLVSASNANYIGKPSIDGGVYYPIIKDHTGPYKVNRKAMSMTINHGRVPTANEIKAWDKDVMADGTGLPEGSGSVEEGEALYEAQCVMCHGDFGSGGGGYPALSKGNAQEMHETLKNQRDRPDADAPVRVFGSYWPQASTLFWYIRDAMPHAKSKTLTTNEVYALTAYILNINEINIDDEEVDEEYVLNREKFLKIKMPNRDGFVPNIAGKNALKDVTKFYKDPSNYGGVKVKASKRCMKNCQDKSVKTVYIKNGGISVFEPPMSIVRDLPKVDKSKSAPFDAKKLYTANCAMCHDTAAPAPGDKAAWSSFLTKGMKKVYKNGIEGTKTGMPAKGGSSLSNSDFKKVVDYMVTFK
jgi:cytochrome c